MIRCILHHHNLTGFPPPQPDHKKIVFMVRLRGDILSLNDFSPMCVHNWLKMVPMHFQCLVLTEPKFWVQNLRPPPRTTGSHGTSNGRGWLLERRQVVPRSTLAAHTLGFQRIDRKYRTPQSPNEGNLRCAICFGFLASSLRASVTGRVRRK